MDPKEFAELCFNAAEMLRHLGEEVQQDVDAKFLEFDENALADTVGPLAEIIVAVTKAAC